MIWRDLKTPYIQSWNVGIHRELGNGVTIEVDCVGSGTHRLVRSTDGNPLPCRPWCCRAGQWQPAETVSGGTFRSAPFVGLPQVTGNTAFEGPIVIESVGNATYNGLKTLFRKRMGHGLDFQAAYTWSHTIGFEL